MQTKTKRCSRCKKFKSTDEFSKINHGYLHSWCKTCRSRYNADYSKQQQQKDPDWLRQKNIKKSYGMTLEEYDQLFKKQKWGLCYLWIARFIETIIYRS